MSELEAESQPSGDSPASEALLQKLELLYSRKGKSSDFAVEGPIHAQALPLVQAELKPGYLERPVGLGSTATVWVAVDALNQKTALKLPRPRLGKLKDIVRVIRAERERLATLNHQNVIRIYNSYEIKLDIGGDSYLFPFYTMEFIEGVKDFGEYVGDPASSFSAETLISYFRDALSGLAFLHSNGVIHCDIKPGNILIAPGGRRALIADLGFAKHLPKQHKNDPTFTEVKHTPDYAHPELHQRVVDASDSGANVATIPRESLHPKFDLYAFGRSMHEILLAIRARESEAAKRRLTRKPILTTYQLIYLSCVAKRLLDGLVQKHDEDQLRSDVIPGLPDFVMEELRYPSADEALEGIERLLRLYDLEGEIPELNPNLSSYIQIPHVQVPMTARVGNVIKHPTFARLSQITQLGFISVIYPGASHTRFEHVLGTFAHCCEYIRALWYDQANCLFQCIMSRDSIELGLVAALLHDIAQYPMAHDLTEIASEFKHEPFTRLVLEQVPPGAEASLADVVWDEWGVDTETILAVLDINEKSSFRHRILNSLINGPLDCDKLDYVRRDSTHLGVSFGSSIDHERFTRNLTTIYKTGFEVVQQMGESRQEQKLEIAEIGVAEKALVVARAIWQTRKEMFAQVYWHHTARALKAMLAFVVRDILIAFKAKGRQQEARLWGALAALVCNPMSYSRTESAGSRVGEGEVEETIGLDESAFLASTCLSPSDDGVLRFLWDFAESSASRAVLLAMRSRALYLRLAVLSHSREKSRYNAIYSQFAASRVRADHGAIEASRQRAQAEITDLAIKALRANDGLLPSRFSVDAVATELKNTNPLILIDMPLKNVYGSEDANKKNEIGFLPEDFAGVHSRSNPSNLGFSFSRAHLDDSDFDRDIGKIRVFAHPDWRDLLVRCLTDKAIISAVHVAFESSGPTSQR